MLSRNLAAAFATVSVVAMATPAYAQAQQFNIPAGSLKAALDAYAKQTGRQVIYKMDEVRSARSKGVKGARTADAALTAILAGTGFRANSDRSGAIAIVRGEGAASTSAGEVLAKSATSENKSAEIVVTGSLIRGTEKSVGTKVATITRDEISKGGFGTVPEILESLPQNFQGGISEDSRTAANDVNLAGGTSINLRGLGAGNTLVLLNGRRLASGGRRGTFVDISSIPASLIDRVEVLADGASATYGSDAIGGVVNIILRDDFEGVEAGFRFGTVTEGGAQEYRTSLTLGENWATGNVLVSYEYFDKENLSYQARSFTETSDLRTLGGDDFRTNFSVPGNIIGGPGFAIPIGQDGTDLDPSDLLSGQTNLFNQNLGRNLQFENRRHSIFIAGSQNVSESIELFAEGSFSQRDFTRNSPGQNLTLRVPPSNPFYVDPFGSNGTIVVRYNSFSDFSSILSSDGDTQTITSSLGAKFDLAKDWQLLAYASYNRDRLRTVSRGLDNGALNLALADPNPNTAFNPFGDGTFTQNPSTIQGISVTTDIGAQSTIKSVNMVADGSLFDLPGGSIKLAVGGSYDDYSSTAFSDNRLSGLTESDFDRDVFALFGELQIPIFGNENARRGLERLIISTSVRYEDYSDVGSTTNPKVGLLWTPLDGVDIRGSYGTSFRAPDFVELDTTSAANASFIFTIPDPVSTTGTTAALLLQGNNSELESETATTWTVGIDVSPISVPGLELDLTYYNVKFDNRITSAIGAGFGSILSQEARFSSAIVRNPTQSQIETACAVDGTFFDFVGGPCLTTPIGAIVDFRLINAGVTQTDGLDFNLRYVLTTSEFSRFNFHVGGTYILNFDEAFDPTAPVTELINTVGNPIGLRLRNSIGWNHDIGLSANLFINYADGYQDNISNPERKIDSWTTFDLSLGFSTGQKLRNIGLDNTTISLTARNLFDNDPPFVNNANGIGYDPENASALGRFISINVTKRW
tara:strand:+ start:10384 stop:13323 length:2940 start_codon:yes stop_codon:yes gene_type:complete